MAPATCDRQILHGGLRRKVTQKSCLKTSLLFYFRRRYFHDVASWTENNWTTSSFILTASIPTSNSRWRRRQMDTHPSWILMFKGDRTSSWDIELLQKVNTYHPLSKCQVSSPSGEQAGCVCFSPWLKRQRLSSITTVSNKNVLQSSFLSNGYSKQQILRIFNPLKRVTPPCREDPTSVVQLPYVVTTFNRISRLSSKHIKTVSLPSRTNSSFF